MVKFIDTYREAYGTEPICAVLPIAPARYHARKARHADSARLPTRAVRDGWLMAEIRRVWNEHHGAYGSRKVWRRLRREGIPIAGATVERLMRVLELRGAMRGGRFRITIRDTTAVRPRDRVERNFRAIHPYQLWVADLAYAATWRGFVYVAFVVDAFARQIVGWGLAHWNRLSTAGRWVRR